MPNVTTKDVVVIQKRPAGRGPFTEVDLKVDGYNCYATFERGLAHGDKAIRIKPGSRYPRNADIPAYLYRPMFEVARGILTEKVAEPSKKPPPPQPDLFPTPPK